MKFKISRDEILKPLQMVVGIVERRQTLPILSNVLIVLKEGKLELTGTDLEVELVAKVSLSEETETGEVTVPARKLFDICKSLPDGSDIHFSMSEENKIVVKSGRSRFSLATLPASDFPTVEESAGALEFEVSQADFKGVIDQTSFAMAQQDVRYYLNGLLIEINDQQIKAVATDGHRLALSWLNDCGDISGTEKTQVIVPRKGIVELSRLMGGVDEPVKISIGTNHFRAIFGDYVFISKLVDGKFPDYQRVLPKGGDKFVIADREELKQAFSRVAILSNEKYRGVRVQVQSGLIKILANNPEQEEAEEEVIVDYQGEDLEIGFNVSYILDVLSAITKKQVKITLLDSNSSALIEDAEESNAAYVVMPMRL